MAQTAILFCPDDDLGFIVQNSGRLRFGCENVPNGDPQKTPQLIDVEAFCGVEDCSAIQGEANGAINQETFEAFYPWALLMLVSAFGIRMIRRVISTRI